MSKTTKKAGDKTKPPASQTPVIAHEIVPGKFTDNDCTPPWTDKCVIDLWNSMVDQDSSDEFVLEILDELMCTTMDTIYDKYMERQLLPFTITQARDAIVEIIQWQFLAQDAGETTINEDLGWTEDEEPEPATTDCWAQGSVPLNTVLAPVPEEPEPVEVTAEVIPEEEVAPEVVEVKEPEELADVVSDTEEKEVTEVKGKKKIVKKSSGQSTEDASQQKSPGGRKLSNFKPYRGKLKSAGVSKMTESLEEREMKLIENEVAQSMPQMEDKPSTLMNMPASCTSILKVQTGRPPGNKDVMYDEMGNVVAVMRLDPEKLPSHKVNVAYHVVDPAVEAAQARLDAMRKGKSTGRVARKSISTKAMSQESLNKGSKVKQAAAGPTVAPLPPPLRKGLKDGEKHQKSTNKKNRNINSSVKQTGDKSGNCVNRTMSSSRSFCDLRHVVLQRNSRLGSDQRSNHIRLPMVGKDPFSQSCLRDKCDDTRWLNMARSAHLLKHRK